MSKEVTGFRPGSPAWKKFMAKLYGIGGAIVIVGALFKIQHWPGASLMLIVGLSVEAIIFFISAFEPLHEDLDWSKVYPELSSHEEDEFEELTEGDEEEVMEIEEKVEDERPIVEQLDSMLEEAKIGPDLISSLGTGLRNLSDQASNMNTMADASIATNEYVENIKSASSNVGKLSDSYAQASESLTTMAVSNENSQKYSDELAKVGSSLSALNSAYESQLGEINKSLDSTNQLYNGIEELMSSLSGSIEDTKKYKDNMAELSSNLESLNNVYGNMLTAMRPS